MTHNPQLQHLYEIWHNKGRNPAYHEKVQAEVRKVFPMLALALDYLVDDKSLRHVKSKWNEEVVRMDTQNIKQNADQIYAKITQKL